MVRERKRGQEEPTWLHFPAVIQGKDVGSLECRLVEHLSIDVNLFHSLTKTVQGLARTCLPEICGQLPL